MRVSYYVNKRIPWNNKILIQICQFEGLALVRSGDEVLEALGLRNANFHDILKNLCILSGANLLVSLIGLIFFGPVYIQAKDDDVQTCGKNITKVTVESSKNLAPPQSVPLVKMLKIDY